MCHSSSSKSPEISHLLMWSSNYKNTFCFYRSGGFLLAAILSNLEWFSQSLHKVKICCAARLKGCLAVNVSSSEYDFFFFFLPHGACQKDLCLPLIGVFLPVDDAEDISDACFFFFCMVFPGLAVSHTQEWLIKQIAAVKEYSYSVPPICSCVNFSSLTVPCSHTLSSFFNLIWPLWTLALVSFYIFSLPILSSSLNCNGFHFPSRYLPILVFSSLITILCKFFCFNPGTLTTWVHLF